MSATYSTCRFAFYGLAKDMLLIDSPSNELTLPQKILIAGAGGAIGALAGNPADLVNIRMQNDVKLCNRERRNYKNCFEAIFRYFELPFYCQNLRYFSKTLREMRYLGYAERKAFLRFILAFRLQLCVRYW